jgi:prepilin-type N-terminal cleavage/methylation domain-containing protein
MRRSNTTKQKGFSIVEMLTVLAILSILMGISVFQYRDFQNNVNLSNVALDAALTVRGAQSYGASTVEVGGSGFQHAYGVHFDESTPTSYVFFVDSTNDDFWYNGGAESLLQQGLDKGNTITEICVGPLATQDCDVTEVGVLFKRPELAARIYSQNGGTSHEGAEIRFTSPAGDTKSLHVTLTGQIYVE